MDSNLVIQPHTGGQAFDERQVPLYYSRKTADILHKYGPGPRVHFHMGLFAPGSTPNTTVSQRVLKRRIVESQEAIVEHAARTWGAYASPPARAARHRLRGRRRLALLGAGARRVRHRPHRRRGTRPGHRAVRAPGRRGRPGHPARSPMSTASPPAEEFDAAYANESSGYMDRERLFQVVAKALKPGGWFGIQEHFICRPEWTEFIDGYYKTRLGTAQRVHHRRRGRGVRAGTGRGRHRPRRGVLGAVHGVEHRRTGPDRAGGHRRHAGRLVPGAAPGVDDHARQAVPDLARPRAGDPAAALPAGGGN